MASQKSVSTPGHIRSVGGETLTYTPEGAIIGALIGASLGTILAVLKLRGEFPFITLGTLSPFMIYVLFIGGFTLVLAAAGAVVGVGVPKINPHPDQGAVKTWRSVVVKKEGHEDVVFVPEELRRDRKSPLSWGKRPAEAFEEGHLSPAQRREKAFHDRQEHDREV